MKKYRIVKGTKNKFFIQKRIMFLFIFPIWIDLRMDGYNYPCFKSIEEAQEVINYWCNSTRSEVLKKATY